MTALWNSKNMTQLLTEVVGQNSTTTMDGMGANQQVMLAQYGWVASLIAWVLWCCIGAAIMFIARYCVADQNTGGLCACSIFEGICACCACLTSCSMFARVIMIFIAVAAYGTQAGKDTVCSTLLGGNTAPINVGGLFTTVPPTASTGLFQTNAQYGNCLEFIDGLRTIYIVAGVYTMIILCLECAIVGACATGAKFAHDTKEALEDEESVNPEMYY